LFAAYIVIQVACLKKLSGALKKAAMVSALVGAAILTYTLVAYSLGSNLFPLLLLLTAPWLFIYVSALSLAGFVVARKS
jgi:hypothetical protein